MGRGSEWLLGRGALGLGNKKPASERVNVSVLLLVLLLSLNPKVEQCHQPRPHAHYMGTVFIWL